MRISHKWHFRFERKAKKALDELSDENRRRVFRSLEELLKAEDPQAVYGVKKLVDVNPPVYRQRQGNYRIIFVVRSDAIMVQNRLYKGIVHIIEIALHHEGY